MIEIYKKTIRESVFSHSLFFGIKFETILLNSKKMKKFFFYILVFVYSYTFSQDDNSIIVRQVDPYSYEYYNNYEISRNDVYYSVEGALKNINSVRVLDLSNSNLDELSYKIGYLKNLEVLILKNNQLTELPYQIGNLQKLRILDVSNNNLTEIPYQIQNLKQLEVLVLNNNQLRELPYQLGDLTSLKIWKLPTTIYQKFLINLKN